MTDEQHHDQPELLLERRVTSSARIMVGRDGPTLDPLRFPSPSAPERPCWEPW